MNDPLSPQSVWERPSDSDGLALSPAHWQQMAESQVVGQLQQRHQILVGGPDAGVPPLYGEGSCPKKVGQLPGRQAGSFLEPL